MTVDGATLSGTDFERIRTFLHDQTGIELRDGKQALVVGRLTPRLRALQLSGFGEYLNLLQAPEGDAERRMAIDLLTTNETYFFREPEHFDLIRSLAGDAARSGRPFRVWSAASSSGEEAYTVALVLADTLGEAPWEIVGTDISQRVLQRAREGRYPLDAAQRIPRPLLKSWCLKGSGELEGLFTVQGALRRRVRFLRANLVQELPDLGIFDVVLLRNVMIYFNQPVKRRVIDGITERIRPGGHLLIGHSEVLDWPIPALERVRPSVYRRTGPSRVPSG